MFNLKVAAIIAAAGLGKRFGEGLRKQFQPLSGKPLIVYSIERFEESKLINEIILVVPKDSINYCQREIKDKFQFKKITKIIPGGKERQQSVKMGFNSVSSETDVVLIHDGVRPFVTARMIDEVIKESLNTGGAIAAIPVKDTVKKSSTKNHVERTLSRDALWLAQTPQAFQYNVLKSAYEKTENDGFLGTDESSLVERIGIRVTLVVGSQTNIKITTKEDLLLGELVFKERTRLLDNDRYDHGENITQSERY